MRRETATMIFLALWTGAIVSSGLAANEWARTHEINLNMLAIAFVTALAGAVVYKLSLNISS